MLFTQKSYFSKTINFIVCSYWIFRYCNSCKFLILTILVLMPSFRIYIISRAYKMFIKQWHGLAVQVFTMSFSIYIVMLQEGKHTISAIITNHTKWQWRFYISSHVVELFHGDGLLDLFIFFLTSELFLLPELVLFDSIGVVGFT